LPDCLDAQDKCPAPSLPRKRWQLPARRAFSACLTLSPKAASPLLVRRLPTQSPDIYQLYPSPAAKSTRLWAVLRAALVFKLNIIHYSPFTAFPISYLRHQSSVFRFWRLDARHSERRGRAQSRNLLENCHCERGRAERGNLKTLVWGFLNSPTETSATGSADSQGSSMCRITIEKRAASIKLTALIKPSSVAMLLQCSAFAQPGYQACADAAEQNRTRSGNRLCTYPVYSYLSVRPEA